MLERSHIEQLLRVNGVKESAPDEEIKSVLVSARWHKKDVETALLVLRENTKSHETHVDSLHKVFQTDDRLHPETITALLGIDVFVPKTEIPRRSSNYLAGLSFIQVLQITCTSVFLATVFVLGFMYHLQMGIFHITMR